MHLADSVQMQLINRNHIEDRPSKEDMGRGECLKHGLYQNDKSYVLTSMTPPFLQRTYNGMGYMIFIASFK